MTTDVFALIPLAQNGDPNALECLVEQNTGLIWSVVRRFYGRGYESDDLFQIGSIGLLKAIQGFDTDYGTQFSTYAVPKITGEILRFLRDDGMVKVSRGIKERAFKINRIKNALQQKLGREPTVSEIAVECGLEPEEIAAAELVQGPAQSLEEPNGESGFSLQMILHDGSEERMLEYAALRQAVEALPLREREVIALRFFRGFTQQKTAACLCISQVQVSRVERKAIRQLKEALAVREPPSVNSSSIT